ncbi:MAG: tetratricopeptide repeat-containing sensor histidine kinase [Prolixibacteraceae bacterium]|nr:tetratricopeptide repeat-containing sensor histidine kinase [Prolixibacteraceae bacterium]
MRFPVPLNTQSPSFFKTLNATGFLITLAFISFGNNKLDSLLFEIKKPHHDTVKFELLLEIGDCYYFNNFDTAMAYFTEARELTETNLEKNKKKNKRLNFKYQQQKAKAIRYIAYVYQNRGDLVTASELYFQALEIGESIGCSLNIYNSYNNIAIINYTRGEYDVALDYFQKAIEITEKTGNRFGRMKLYNNMGVLLYDMGKETDSIPKRIEHFKSARDNFDKALQLRIEFNDQWGQMLCYNNLGNLTRDEAKLTDNAVPMKENLSKAIDYYNRSFVLAKALNDLMGMSKATGNKAELYLMLHELDGISMGISWPDSAVYYAGESYRYANGLNSTPQKNNAALVAKKAFELSGDITKALEFANIYIETRDELFSAEKTKSLDEMRVKYETEKKENEIQLLSKENELKEIRIRNEKREKFLFVIIAVTAIALSAMFFVLFYNRQKTGRLLKTKNEELQKLNTTKDKFISILAHDLKNPLSAFLNITSALTNDYDNIDDKQKRKFIHKIHQSALQINNLLKNMLEWAVVKHKTDTTNYEKMNLSGTIDYVTETLSGLVSDYKAEIKNRASEQIHVYANKAYLIAVFNNLITNALKFSENDKTITINAFTEKYRAVISVEDKGIGIAPGDIEKLFRLDVDTRTIGKSDRGKKGTGMGLILCKELIEKMNGGIHIESEPGKGSKFIFTLPLVKP